MPAGLEEFWFLERRAATIENKKCTCFTLDRARRYGVRNWHIRASWPIFTNTFLNCYEACTVTDLVLSSSETGALRLNSFFYLRDHRGLCMCMVTYSIVLYNTHVCMNHESDSRYPIMIRVPLVMGATCSLNKVCPTILIFQLR